MGDEARIREIFNRFDKDGSGEISARELVEVLRETDRIQNPGRDEGERDNIVKRKAGFILVRCDKNDDMKLTWDEFYSTLSAYVD